MLDSDHLLPLIKNWLPSLVNSFAPTLEIVGKASTDESAKPARSAALEKTRMVKILQVIFQYSKRVSGKKKAARSECARKN
jgi:hypothetical protein